MGSKPYVFTLLTKESPGYFDLLESAKRWGWELRSHWIPPEQGDFEVTYHNFISKKHLLIREVLQTWPGEGKYFLFLDAWDCLFLGPPEELQFEDYMLNFSGSLDCYPEKGYARFFSGEMPYLNSGVIWGSMVTYLSRCPGYQANDQLVWTREIVESPTGLKVDSGAKVALTIYGEQDLSNYSRINGRWRYNPTGTFPLVAHAGGKWPMPEAFKK